MIENEGSKKFHIIYDTRTIRFEEVDKIHSDMVGTIGGDKIDIEIDDIAFNDDSTAVVIGFIKGSSLKNKSSDSMEQQACQTTEESDQNLHKFIVKFIHFKWIE